MSQKTYKTSDLGDILIVKRRGSKNIRLTLTSKHQVRVSIPSFIPYRVGLEFAIARKDWLKNHLSLKAVAVAQNGSKIGKSHRLGISQTSANQRSSTLIKNQLIKVSLASEIDEQSAQKIIVKACEKALKIEAGNLLPIRIKDLAQQHKYTFKDVKVRQLRSRWGSCNSSKEITLSIYLIQLPWHLIDYVLLHELAHTKHMNHQAPFWQELTQKLPNAKTLKKEIKQFDPVLIPM